MKHPGVITRLLGHVDAARIMSGRASDLLSQAYDMERSLIEGTNLNMDDERKALIEEAIQRLAHAETTLADAYEAVIEAYPADKFS